MSYFPESATTAGWWAQVASFSGQLYLSANRELRLPRVHEHTFTDKLLWWLSRPTMPVLGLAWLFVMATVWYLEIHLFYRFLIFTIGGLFVIACWKGLHVRPQYVTDDHEQRKSVYQPMRRFFSKIAALGLIPVFVTTFNEKLPVQVQMALPYLIHGLLWNVHAYAEYLERNTKNKQELAFLEFIDDATGIPEEEAAAAKKKAEEAAAKAKEAAGAATEAAAALTPAPGTSATPAVPAAAPSVDGSAETTTPLIPVPSVPENVSIASNQPQSTISTPVTTTPGTPVSVTYVAVPTTAPGYAPGYVLAAAPATASIPSYTPVAPSNAPVNAPVTTTTAPEGYFPVYSSATPVPTPSPTPALAQVPTPVQQIPVQQVPVQQVPVQQAPVQQAPAQQVPVQQVLVQVPIQTPVQQIPVQAPPQSPALPVPVAVVAPVPSTAPAADVPSTEERTGDLAAVEEILEAVTGRDIPSPDELAEIIGVDPTKA